MSRHTRFVVLIVLAGCAAGRAATETGATTPEPEGSVQDYERRIEGMQGELALKLGSQDAEVLERPDAQSLEQSPIEEMPVARVPDCTAAAELRDRICDLAERICKLATRDGSLHGKCESARKACDKAKNDVAQTCGG